MATRLSDFKLEEVLSTNAQTKSVILLGTISDSAALVTISRAQIPDVSKGLPLEEVKLLENNDIYSWALATMKQNLEDAPAAKVDVIWPATETHIAKYRPSKTRCIVETMEMYNTVVRPYIDSMLGDRIQWVKAILFDGAEADRVIYRDNDVETGFVLLPNSKWDGKSIESLYLLVLVIREDLRSIRDLTTEHLPLLQNIKEQVTRQVKERYNLDPSELKLYFHYQPSYYHLHVHVANVSMDQSDFGRSILFDNVIDAINRGGFENISYNISESHKLWGSFKDQNLI
ncbi:m7GpppX diphosphatase [Wickerhamiella sorbophila]|uniref:M7GpppX diphosphatase n=1 Tax=Wickerhamiella sorbophila TaxID=45607 RepID=A0A2T0FG60_9ASCO|nr:m7GpppX diphosphatase [Wickerhamiella sorbophila]PRT53939.1 m7GpppX diphosphatase [Wickerhamiella sorbophila]